MSKACWLFTIRAAAIGAPVQPRSQCRRSVGAGGQWHRAMVSMFRKRTCILVSMSMPCQIWSMDGAA